MTRIRRLAAPATALLLLAAGPAVVRAEASPGSIGVVSFAGPTGVAALAGLALDVVARFPALDAVAVRGMPAALRAAAGRPGVRAVAPDAPLRPNSHPVGADRESVLPWERLGGPAGQPGAGAGVTVALVDTGVADTAALDRASGRLVDALDTSGEGDFVDRYGHGTFMAGVIAGGPVPGTSTRALGVAPAARVLNVKVAGADGGTSLVKVLGGLDWVASHAAQVDVASFAFSRTRPGSGYGPDPLTDAVERVHAAGVAVVVSAGNVPGEVGDPGFDPWLLTVGAADVRGGHVAVAPWSGGAVVAGVPKPDVVASGVGVLSVLPEQSVIARSFPQARRGSLWRGSGTSQATAQTAGVAALFLQRFPDADPATVKASLRAAARPLPGRRWSGAGLVAVAHRVVVASDGPGTDAGGGSGTGGFDANSWSANSWSANSWSANSWSANSWSANSWSANSWSANSWSDADSRPEDGP